MSGNKTAFVFPGQGSQHVGMAKALHEKFPEVRNLYSLASEALGYDVAELSFNGPEDELNKTANTQPCLLAASIAAFTVITARGIRADAMAGHSLGEYTAHVAAGTIAFSDALRATEMRGRVMQEAVPQGKGMMAAVLGLDRKQVEKGCASVGAGYVAPANYNCPGQIVIAGETEAVYEAITKFKELGAKRVMPLSVSVPSHSKLMASAAERLSEFLVKGDISIESPSVPVFSNATAGAVDTPDKVRDALVKQLYMPVLWEDTIAAMLRSGVGTFVEVGPGKVLTGLIKRINSDVRTINVQDPQSLESACAELAAHC